MHIILTFLFVNVCVAYSSNNNQYVLLKRFFKLTLTTIVVYTCTCFRGNRLIYTTASDLRCSLYAVGYASVFLYTFASLSASMCSTRPWSCCWCSPQYCDKSRSRSSSSEKHNRCDGGKLILNNYLKLQKETTVEQNKIALFQSPQGLVSRQINIVCHEQLLMYNTM